MKYNFKWLPLALAVTLCAVLFSCNHAQENHKGHEVHVHDARLLLTGYGNEYEVFAETSPFIVQEKTKILAHFSKLTNFKPLIQGKVTATLTVDGKSISQTLKHPLRKGIYAFELQPVKKGEGTLSFIITDAQGTSKTLISAITVYDNEHTAHHEAEEQEPHTSNGVVFTKEKSWKIDFSTAVINAEPFHQVVKTTAQIQSTTGGEKCIVAQTSGIVQLNSKDITEGQAVKRGQRLFTLQSQGLTNDNLSVRYQQVKARYKEAKSLFKQKEPLAKEGIISQTNWQAVQRNYKEQKAAYDNLRNHFTKKGQNISSPMNGYIKDLQVKNGSYVTAGTPLFTVAQNKFVYLKAWIQPRYYNLLKHFSGANISIPQTQETYTLQALNGRLVSFGQTTSVQQPLLPVTFQIANTHDWLPGRFVDLYLQARTDEKKLAVPRTAIVEEMGNTFLFVQVTPELFEKRLVTCGISDGRHTVILQGLKSGERIVTQGATLVKLSQTAGALDPHAGHVH